jgi:glycosyltransferase involved in cell wall biosynthesis
MGKNVRCSCPTAIEERILSAADYGVAPAPISERPPGAQASVRPLRILTLTPFYPSREDPAQGCFIADPLPWTQRFGVANQVFAAQPFYRRPRHEIGDGVPSRWLTYRSFPGKLGLIMSGAAMARALMHGVRRLHADQRFDLIHAHAALPCGQAAAILSDRLGVPFVVSVHGLDAFATKQSGPWLAPWSRKLSANVYRRARAVICISHRVCEQVAQFVATNTVVVHNGVDVDMFSPGKESKSAPIILSVGNLIPIKGHALLLRAFAKLISDRPGCRLEIIGDGIERANLMHLAAALGVAAQVQFSGRQSRQAIAEAMRQCAVFALPSSYEGLGCVYLEAMASGKPAIACKGQGIEDIIDHGKNGLLISPGSEQELADSLHALLLSHDYRRRLGEAARNTILERHTLQHQAQQLVRIYQECVR